MSRCRSCQAEVLFIRSAKSRKPMILNAEPEQRVVLVQAEDTLILAGKADAPESVRARVVPVYVPHHATCPQAAAWRRGR